MISPFVIFALPRSRTYWLSRFLSYREWQCGHDEIRYLRSLDDVKSWLSQPYTGTAETGAAPFWRLLRHYQPDTRIAVIRRPVDEVVQSLIDTGVEFDVELLTKKIRALDHKLDQIEHRVRGVKSFVFADLESEITCAELFEHCLPYAHDPIWWGRLDPLDLQINLHHMMRYFTAHRPQLEKVAAQAKHRILSTFLRPSVIDGVTFQIESMTSYEEAIPLFKEHAVVTDRDPEAYLRVNVSLMEKLEELGLLQIMSARSNGRLFGYLMSVVGPSLEDRDKVVACHTAFFASPLIPNLGLKLQRAAADTLRARGVSAVEMRAGIRGSGPRLGSFYKRMGAEDFGQLFRLDLED